MNNNTNIQRGAAQATIMKWGNSQGIRIPRSILNNANMKENDRIEIFSTEDKIIIQKQKKFKNLKERLEAFYGKPLEEISPIKDDEVDWGAQEGNEVW